jgi:hypothetical protein
LSFRFSLLLIATAIVLLGSAVAPAQSPQTTISIDAASAKLGDQVVVLPAPEGFEEATQQFEAVKTRFAATEPPESDLLAGYLTVSDCDRLRQSQTAVYPSWTKIAVLRAARAHDFSTEEYAGIVEYFRKNGASAMDPDNKRMKQGFAHLDEVLSKEYSTGIKVDFDKPIDLGEFDRRPNVYSSLLLMNLKAQAEGQEYQQLRVFATVTILLVKKRILVVATYRKFESKADAETLTRFTTKWVNEILAAN